eukprot:TRINITY_DN2513_c1_g1_i1.p1 TRINITY_DN2513_c1_g1~~TRINITY_DN2513_c1_g1_i1.p1  ORF type:complete len:251 (-),score=16.62 TRINITY_DN2513_c1_g1_i1:33-785(-)
MKASGDDTLILIWIFISFAIIETIALNQTSDRVVDCAFSKTCNTCNNVTGCIWSGDRNRCVLETTCKYACFLDCCQIYTSCDSCRANKDCMYCNTDTYSFCLGREYGSKCMNGGQTEDSCPSESLIGNLLKFIEGFVIASVGFLLLVSLVFLIFFIRNAIERESAESALHKYQKKYNKKNIRICQYCRDGVATVRCLKCRFILCNSCSESIHNNVSKSDHNPESLEYDSSSNEDAYTTLAPLIQRMEKHR